MRARRSDLISDLRQLVQQSKPFVIEAVAFTIEVVPSHGRYEILIMTPECVQAMLTLQPDLSAIPTPTKTGWTFRRQ